MHLFLVTHGTANPAKLISILSTLHLIYTMMPQPLRVSSLNPHNSLPGTFLTSVTAQLPHPLYYPTLNHVVASRNIFILPFVLFILYMCWTLVPVFLLFILLLLFYSFLLLSPSSDSFLLLL